MPSENVKSFHGLSAWTTYGLLLSLISATQLKVGSDGILVAFFIQFLYLLSHANFPLDLVLSNVDSIPHPQELGLMSTVRGQYSSEIQHAREHVTVLRRQQI